MLIVNRNTASTLHTPHGSVIRPLIDRTTSPVTQCSLAEEMLPPGAAVAAHHHEMLEEIYYILEGTGIMTIGEEQRAVGAGDAIYIPRGRRHTLCNTGDSPMRVVLVCGPAFMFEDHRTDAGDGRNL